MIFTLSLFCTSGLMVHRWNTSRARVTSHVVLLLKAASWLRKERSSGSAFLRYPLLVTTYPSSSLVSAMGGRRARSTEPPPRVGRTGVNTRVKGGRRLGGEIPFSIHTTHSVCIVELEIL